MDRDQSRDFIGETRQSRDYPADDSDFESAHQNDFIYGVYPCLLALMRKSREVHRAFIRKDYYQTDVSRVQNPSKMLLGVRQILEILEKERVPVMLYNRAALSFMAQDKPHQGVVLEVSPRPITVIDDENIDHVLAQLENQHHVIILDGIRDPMNLGAILRTCCFLMGSGNSVIVTPQTSVLSPACAKASSGAVELLNFYKSANAANLIDLLKTTQNRIVIGTDEPCDQSTSLEDVCQLLNSSSNSAEGKQKSVIVFGFEGTGVSKELLSKCDHVLSIEAAASQTENHDVDVNFPYTGII